MERPHFTIRNRFQKRSELYQHILTRDILSDVCRRITSRRDYTVNFDDTGYNKGRLATLEYNGAINYISFSEFEIGSRNSFFQSFPSALVKYHQESNTHKNIFFYFLEPDGNIETAYFIFMYRLMKTAGTTFLNEADNLTTAINPFNSVSDIIVQRDLNRGRNRGNVSSYVTIDENDVLQIFGKTYGANKYETTLLCLAIHGITPYAMKLYEIQEGKLKRLPKDAIDGDNGMWLCNNHHMLFDINMLYITHDGRLKYRSNIEQSHKEYLRDFTVNRRISNKILTPTFIDYLDKRNRMLVESQYSYVV